MVLASGNRGKLKEMGEILADIGIELVPQTGFTMPAVEETGLSYVENAILKARAAASVSGLPAIADDSGIEVDALGGEPGLYSARYAGDGASDQQNLDHLLRNLAASGSQNTRARYRCAIIYVRHAKDPCPVIAEACWEGFIVMQSQGKNGFGYDPIFYVPTHGCTSAELPPEVKNRISHRGKALEKLARKLNTLESPCAK